MMFLVGCIHGNFFGRSIILLPKIFVRFRKFFQSNIYIIVTNREKDIQRREFYGVLRSFIYLLIHTHTNLHAQPLYSIDNNHTYNIIPKLNYAGIADPSLSFSDTPTVCNLICNKGTIQIENIHDSSFIFRLNSEFRFSRKLHGVKKYEFIDTIHIKQFQDFRRVPSHSYVVGYIIYLAPCERAFKVQWASLRVPEYHTK